MWTGKNHYKTDPEDITSSCFISQIHKTHHEFYSELFPREIFRITHSVRFPPSFCWKGEEEGGGCWTSDQFFKKGGGGGGLTGSQILEGIAGKEWVTFFREDYSFYIKNKLKSQIFNDQKSLSPKIFSVSQVRI